MLIALLSQGDDLRERIKGTDATLKGIFWSDCLFINSDLCRIPQVVQMHQHKIKEKAEIFILNNLTTTNRYRRIQPCTIQRNRTVHHEFLLKHDGLSSEN